LGGFPNKKMLGTKLFLGTVNIDVAISQIMNPISTSNNYQFKTKQNYWVNTMGIETLKQMEVPNAKG